MKNGDSGDSKNINGDSQPSKHGESPKKESKDGLRKDKIKEMRAMLGEVKTGLVNISKEIKSSSQRLDNVSSQPELPISGQQGPVASVEDSQPGLPDSAVDPNKPESTVDAQEIDSESSEVIPGFTTESANVWDKYSESKRMEVLVEDSVDLVADKDHNLSTPDEPLLAEMVDSDSSANMYSTGNDYPEEAISQELMAEMVDSDSFLQLAPTDVPSENVPEARSDSALIAEAVDVEMPGEPEVPASGTEFSPTEAELADSASHLLVSEALDIDAGGEPVEFARVAKSSRIPKAKDESVAAEMTEDLEEDKDGTQFAQLADSASHFIVSDVEVATDNESVEFAKVTGMSSIPPTEEKPITGSTSPSKEEKAIVLEMMDDLDADDAEFADLADSATHSLVSGVMAAEEEDIELAHLAENVEHHLSSQHDVVGAEALTGEISETQEEYSDTYPYSADDAIDQLDDIYAYDSKGEITYAHDSTDVTIEDTQLKMGMANVYRDLTQMQGEEETEFQEPEATMVDANIPSFGKEVDADQVDSDPYSVEEDKAAEPVGEDSGPATIYRELGKLALPQETDEATEDSSEARIETQKAPLEDIEAIAKVEALASSQRTAKQRGRLEIGDIINNKYKIVDFLGEGGMGAVFKVQHLLLEHKRYFALKLLHPRFSSEPRFLKRFKREVEVTMEFVHENVIQIRDFGETERGGYYFTMDFSDGTPLNEVIEAEGVLSVNKSLTITMQILSALKSAHAEEIIHRDLKPENIILENRKGKLHVLVLDFGIAKVLNTDSEKITMGILGTPLYMSPEQSQGLDVDKRSDIYSLGVTLYHMVTGQTPFSGSSMDVLYGHLTKEPPEPSTIRSSIPAPVDELILKALAKEPYDRYSSAEEFSKAIDQVCQELEVADKPTTQQDLWGRDSGEVTQDSPALDIGYVISEKYKIVDVLGEGGMGIVYKVEHLMLTHKKYFALKLLHAHLSRDSNFRDRFVREVEMAMEFSHEHVVQIRDFGETQEGRHYFTMDFSTGVSLNDVIKKENRLPVHKALTITRQVLMALKNAHAKGIAHRDLKPDNILVENRQGKPHALVLDFGIAKLLTKEEDSRQITHKAIFGTPHYMSPEQAGGEELDMRTDIYSLGVILYEMLTGQVPFSGQTRVILTAHMTRTPRKPRNLSRDIPIPVENLILKSLAKDRNKRYSSAEEFIKHIDAIEKNEQKIYQRHKLKLVLQQVAVIALLFLSTVGGIAFYFQTQEYRNLQKKFYSTLANINLQQGQNYLLQIESMWLGTNTWLRPGKLNTLSMCLQIEDYLRRQKADAAAVLIAKLKQNNMDTGLLKILEGQLQIAQQQTALLQQVMRFLQQKQFFQAERYVKQNQKNSMAAPLLSIIKKLSLIEQNYQQQKWAPLLSKLDNVDKELDKVPAIELSYLENYRQIARQKLKQRQNAQKLLERFKAMLDAKDLVQAKPLLEELQKIPVIAEKLQPLANLYHMENAYRKLQSISGSKKIHALKNFLRRYSGSPYCKQIERSLHKLQSRSRSKLQRLIAQAKQDYKNGKLVSSRKKLISLFRNKQYRLLATKDLREVFRYLGQIYYHQGDWKRAGKWLTKSSHIQSRGYLGLVYYQLQRDSNARSLIGKILDSPEISAQLEKELLRAMIAIYLRSYPNEERKLVVYLQRAIASMPQEIEYYKKMGQIARNSGDKQKAIQYFKRYLEAAKQQGREDQNTANDLLAMQEFYPLRQGYMWSYSVFKLADQSISSISFSITDQNGNYFTRRDNTGYTEQLIIEDGFIRQRSKKILPIIVSLWSTWNRPGYNVRVTDYNKKIRVDAGEFECLVVTATSTRDSAYVREYYAAGIGEVKTERYRNGQKIYERELTRYRSMKNQGF